MAMPAVSAAVFVLGATAVFAQIVFAREFLVAFHGNEVALGLVFGGWLAGIGLGAAASSSVAPRVRARALLPWVLIPLPILLPGQVLLARLWHRIAGILPGAYPAPGLVALGAFLVLLPTAGVIGFAFAVACGAADASRDRRVVGRIYLAESLGSTAGGMIMTFVLLPRCSLVEQAAIASACGWLAAWLAATPGADLPHRAARPARIATLAGALLLALAFATGVLDAAARRTRDLGWSGVLGNEGGRVVAERDTPYERLTLIENRGQFSLFANGEWAGSFPDDLTFETAAHTALCQHPLPRRVLLLGGLPPLARPILQHPVVTLDIVLLDPQLLRFLEPSIAPPDRAALRDPRVHVHYRDPGAFVRTAAGQYDVILLEAPEPRTVALNRFFTVEFFERVKARLDPGGVFAFSLPTSIHLEGESAGLAASLRASLAAVFDDVRVSGDAQRWFFAALDPSPLTLDGATLFERFGERGISPTEFSPYHFLAADSFSPEKIAFTSSRLDSVPSPGLNSDLHPLGAFMALVLWGRYTGSSFASLLHGAARVPAPAWFVPGLLVAALLLPGKRSGAVRGAALYALASTGFAALALQLIVLIVYQDIFGFLYERIGLVTALFMFGLAAGAATSNRRLLRIERVGARSVAGLDAAMTAWAVLTAAMSVALLSAAPAHPLARPAVGHAVLALLAFGNGALTGALFPWINRWLHDAGDPPVRAAAWTDAADHLGAVGGALLVGVLWLPVYGIAAAALLTAALKAPGTVLIITGRGQRQP